MPVGTAPAERSEEQLAWSADFAVFSTEIEEAYPRDFAYSGIYDDYSGAYIAFKDAVPDGVSQTIGELTQVELLPNAGFTSLDMQLYAASLLDGATEIESESAYSVGVTPRPVERSFDVQIGAVSLEDDGADETEPIEPAKIAEIEAEITQFVEASPPIAGFSVVINADAGVVTNLEDEDGGRTLAGVCTGAFPIKRNGGAELGILTAGHCPGTGSYDDTSGMFNPVYPNSLSTSLAPNTGGDFRWNHSRYMLSGYTALGTGGRKKFSESANPVYGSDVCLNGKTSGHVCERVVAVGTAVSIYIPDGGRNYDIGPLSCTTVHVTDGGDSGGPWYMKSTSVAAGIHSGFYHNTSCFSLVRNALNKLGVSLWVG